MEDPYARELRTHSIGAVTDLTGQVDNHEEADGLPTDTIILTEQGGYWVNLSPGLWYEPGNGCPSRAEDLTYPAQIIYEPEA